MSLERFIPGSLITKKSSFETLRQKITSLMPMLRLSRFGIARKFIVAIILFSSLLSLIATCLELYINYKDDVLSIRQQLANIEKSHRHSLGNDIWLFNEQGIMSQLKGILSLPMIETLRVERKDLPDITLGQASGRRLITQAVPISYNHRDKTIMLGTLYITASTDGAFNRLKERSMVILVTQFMQILFVSAFIFFLFYFLVGRHLKVMALHAESLNSSNLLSQLNLQRNSDISRNKDELDQVVEAINAMQLQIYGEIIERRHAEEEVHRLNAKLEQRVIERTAQLESANKDLDAFCYSVSHDLGAPLRHIDAYVDMLVSRCRDDLNDIGLRYLDTIAASARQMGTMIDDLLQFSRTGRSEIQKDKVEMNQIVKESLTILQESSLDRSIDWVIEDLPTVRGDYALLRQVWVNLLGNALKYTRTRKVARIEVKSFEDKGEIVFVVKDNGVGFNMQYVGKLFGVFQRLHSQEEFEGTGIGLATVQRIISSHDGRVWAEGEQNKGAKFYFALPKCEGQVQG